MGCIDKYVIFKIHNNSFGLQINTVSEIIALQKLSEIPNMPEYIDGITNLRGRIITVLNLRKRFGFALENNLLEEKIVLIQGTNIGFRVDFVDEITNSDCQEIIEPEQFHRELNDCFIWKLMKRNGGVTIILEPLEIIKHSHLSSVNKCEQSFADLLEKIV